MLPELNFFHVQLRLRQGTTPLPLPLRRHLRSCRKNIFGTKTEL
jgi:hypothetical protein